MYGFGSKRFGRSIRIENGLCFGACMAAEQTVWRKFVAIAKQRDRCLIGKQFDVFAKTTAAAVLTCTARIGD